jgi:hypothetical protein
MGYQGWILATKTKQILLQKCECRQLLINPVAVEKVQFLPKSQNLGDSKYLAIPEEKNWRVRLSLLSASPGH